MSSTIIHISSQDSLGSTRGPLGASSNPSSEDQPIASAPYSGTEGSGTEAKNPFLVALGERVKIARARKGMTRRALAQAAEVSDRHLANLEYGLGNPSILVLLQVANALQCSLAELVGDVTTQSPEWLLLRELLQQYDEAALRQIRMQISESLGAAKVAPGPINPRLALIGLRGAGKSTLGKMLAEDLGFPFVELSQEIEKFAGCSIAEIQALYGVKAYRR